MENKYGFISDGKIYLKSVLGNPDREIGTVLLTDEKAVEYFQNRFKKLIEKIDQLEEELNVAPNKGSFLMKIIHLKKQLHTYNGLGDFETINNKLIELENSLQGNVQVNRERNLTLKKDLLEQVQLLTERKDYSRDEEEIKQIHQHWLRIGRVTEDSESIIEKTFKALVDQFFLEKREEQEAKMKVINSRLDIYNEIQEKARELFYKRRYAEHKTEFIQLQQKWKTVGEIPKDKFFKLSRDFKKLGNKYFEKLNEEVKYARSRPRHEHDVLKVKRAICERSRAVYELPPEDAFQLVKLLQDEWKDSGFIPKKIDPGMFNDFYKNCEYAYEYRFFNNMCDERFGASSSIEDKKALMQELIASSIKDIEIAEDELNTAKDQGLEETKKLASNLMVKRRKLEAQEFILESFEN